MFSHAVRVDPFLDLLSHCSVSDHDQAQRRLVGSSHVQRIKEKHRVLLSIKTPDKREQNCIGRNPQFRPHPTAQISSRY